ncbi:hypothetical protein CBL_07747 [Carabus blaptoides fortunei]
MYVERCTAVVAGSCLAETCLPQFSLTAINSDSFQLHGTKQTNDATTQEHVWNAGTSQWLYRFLLLFSPVFFLRVLGCCCCGAYWFRLDCWQYFILDSELNKREKETDVRTASRADNKKLLKAAKNLTFLRFFHLAPEAQDHRKKYHYFFQQNGRENKSVPIRQHLICSNNRHQSTPGFRVVTRLRDIRLQHSFFVLCDIEIYSTVSPPFDAVPEDSVIRTH